MFLNLCSIVYEMSQDPRSGEKWSTENSDVESKRRRKDEYRNSCKFLASSL